MLEAEDVRILRALQIDPRVSFATAAGVLGVSELTVARRYRRMHRAGWVRVVGVVDPGALGQSQWLVRLSCRPGSVTAIAESLAQRDDVSWVALTAAGSEVTCAVHSRSQEERDDLLGRRLPRAAAVLGVRAAVQLRKFTGGRGHYWNALNGVLTAEQEAALGSTGKSPYAERPITRSGRASLGPTSVSAASRGSTSLSAASLDATPLSATPPSATPLSAAPLSAASHGATPLSATSLSRASRGTKSVSAARTLTAAEEKLIAALAEDGRASLVDLAAATGLTPGQVSRRLQSLLGEETSTGAKEGTDPGAREDAGPGARESADPDAREGTREGSDPDARGGSGAREGAGARQSASAREGGVLYFDVEVVPAALGYHARAGLHLRVHPGRVVEVGRALASMPEVAFAAAISGPDNLHAVVHCRDLDELFELTTGRIGALPGVDGLEVSPITRQVKQIVARVDGERLTTSRPGAADGRGRPR
ncbi:Lrp/AsnC family transcriptional regulator [Paractinoplanes atraurantiacus]|uniref:DNA-binding transcriptional regulator, Lrp family n=1 Tax=Paractinoplanes atraurantiacus TaxID=1036182 RepID=A0A285HTB2_9ACTN|nr:Lrp/AsnC family transcriptional regulator [Actinoplanes atraurantiacus]SNY38978.1 DNA-binding transcriptional regulator, Lrp family [Actinoplanes atraurantiacus]